MNILVAIRLFVHHWSDRKILVKCDNQAGVSVLKSGRTQDPYLSACAGIIWCCGARHDIDMRYMHLPGANNSVVDLLSRWQGSLTDFEKLHILLQCKHFCSQIWNFDPCDTLRLASWFVLSATSMCICVCVPPGVQGLCFIISKSGYYTLL